MSLYYHTLANGLRLVHIMTPSRVAWCGLAVNAGSRDEASGYYGLAHFVEHTIFKGRPTAAPGTSSTAWSAWAAS